MLVVALALAAARAPVGAATLATPAEDGAGLSSAPSAMERPRRPIELAQSGFPPPPRAKPRPKIPAGSSGARFTARLAPGAEPIRADVDWQVTSLATGGQIPVTGALPAVELPPGRYRARADGGLVSAQTEFTIAPREVAEVEVVLDAGRLAATVVPGVAAMPLEKALVRVRRAGEAGGEPVLIEEGGVDALLPAGEYEVEARLGHTGVREPVTVRAGETSAVELVLEVGFVLARAYAAEGTEPLSGATFILRDAAAVDGHREIARAGGRHAVFAVGPGEYRLVTRFGLAEVEETVRVAANRLTAAAVTLNAARVELAVAGPAPETPIEQPATYRVFRYSPGAGAEDGRLEILSEISASRTVLRLPAGSFVIEAERAGVVTRSTLTLRPGESRALRLVLKSGLLDVEARAGVGPLDPAAIAIRATPLGEDGFATAPAIELGVLSEGPFSVPAGRYRITGILGPGGASAATDVAVAVGNLSRASLSFVLGSARLKILEKPDGAAVAGAHWRLRTVSGGRPSRVIGGAVDVKLAPGVYDVVAAAGEREATGRLTVEAGKVATLTLIAE